MSSHQNGSGSVHSAVYMFRHTHTHIYIYIYIYIQYTVLSLTQPNSLLLTSIRMKHVSAFPKQPLSGFPLEGLIMAV
jgi:hypothetical protein